MGKTKRDQGSMQAHKNVGGLSMDTLFENRKLKRQEFENKKICSRPMSLSTILVTELNSKRKLLFNPTLMA